ncbi:hypothetical protein [Streptomyces sp. VB1]|uniref:hypothetical protein n=1 Tax=Streptomyces sp. VB1 TaxID=2986803 RepID=UPI0022425293|nr:hypothetical protein [Streptomyces sp. VB1]UZI30361.1 hypothetical protein OH133_20840 [Streptomyces sp. VB1]
MSSNDQQYPYPYDPERQQQPASPHWPDGTAGQSAAPQDPAGFDQGGTQTWQAPTWDTQYQPTIRPDGEQHRAGDLGQGQGPGQGYGQPQQPDPYGQQQPGPYAAPEPHPPYGQQYQDPQYQHQHQQQDPQYQQQYQDPHQQYQDPQQHQPYRRSAASAADTAYLPPQGASGSYPLPPEVPATPAAPLAPAAPVSAPEPMTVRPEAGDTGYGAPTTLGDARLTDAQRARAEGRSPIIAPGMQPAVLTAVLGLLLAGGAAIGPYALLVPVVLLQAVTAAGWFRLNGMWPARQGIALAFAGGLVADVALLVAGREHGPAALLGTLGVWVLLTVVLQLRSHAGADERMHGLMATVVSASLAVLAGGFLAAVPDAVTVGGAVVAAATLVRALPLPGIASIAVTLLAGAGAGLIFGNTADVGAKGVLLGLAVGGCVLIGLRVASYDYPSRFVHMTAGVALPLTVAAPAVYLVGRAIL